MTIGGRLDLNQWVTEWLTSWVLIIITHPKNHSCWNLERSQLTCFLIAWNISDHSRLHAISYYYYFYVLSFFYSISYNYSILYLIIILFYIFYIFLFFFIFYLLIIQFYTSLSFYSISHSSFILYLIFILSLMLCGILLHRIGTPAVGEH